MVLKPMALLAVGVVMTMASPMVVHSQKQSKTPPVPLSVEFDDAGMLITSDGLGPYVDGVDGVSANIDQYGNLIINFQDRRSANRKLYYDYSEPLDGQPTGGGIAPPNNYFSTIRRSGDSVKMQDLSMGASQCVAGGPQYTLDDDDQTQYRHSFQRGGIFDVTDTSFLLVTRTSATTWTVESENACSGGNPNGVALLISTPSVGKWKFTNLGRYRMPMRLTLTAR